MFKYTIKIGSYIVLPKKNGTFNQSLIGTFNQSLIGKNNHYHWLAQIHFVNQFYMVELTNQFLQCTG
jgi:hypothetical protein